MATLTDLAIRTLQLMQVLGSDETPSAADKKKALEKITAAHEYLKTNDLVQWVITAIPSYAEEPYVMIAAFLAAPDFMLPANPLWLQLGETQIRRALNLPKYGTTQAEYF